MSTSLHLNVPLKLSSAAILTLWNTLWIPPEWYHDFLSYKQIIMRQLCVCTSPLEKLGILSYFSAYVLFEAFYSTKQEALLLWPKCTQIGWHLTINWARAWHLMYSDFLFKSLFFIVLYFCRIKIKHLNYQKISSNMDIPFKLNYFV